MIGYGNVSYLKPYEVSNWVTISFIKRICFPIMPRKKSNVSVSTTIRLTEGLREFIENDVKVNQIHRDRSDWIMTAIIHYMELRMEQEKQKREAPPPHSKNAVIFFHFSKKIVIF